MAAPTTSRSPSASASTSARCCVGDEANVQGHSINVAARIQALARPGGICITEAVQRAVHDTLGLEIRPLGPQTLKNISDPVEVFAIEVNGAQAPVSVELPGRRSAIIDPFTEASVAVLPVANQSHDPRDSHLCDGFTGDLITNLSRFRDLRVIARHSAFLFKDRELESSQVAGRLGVRYLVTGGLQRSGRKLRLRVQLTEAATDRVIWSDRYDGNLGDLFAFQDDVTAMVSARLAVQISAVEQRRLLADQPPELHAYGLMLRGQDLSLCYRKDSNLHARRLFEQAAEIDPDYGRCYAGMSRTFNLAWRYQWTPKPEIALDKAVDLANAAIRYDSLDARGFGELGFAQLYKKHHDESLAAYRRAVQLNPNDADLLAEMGDAMTYCSQTGQAIDLLQAGDAPEPVSSRLVFLVSRRSVFLCLRLRESDQDIAPDAAINRRRTVCWHQAMPTSVPWTKRAITPNRSCASIRTSLWNTGATCRPTRTRTRTRCSSKAFAGPG